MDIQYHKRRLKANKVRRHIQAVRTLLLRIRVLIALIMTAALCFFGVWVLKLPQWYINQDKLQNLDPDVIKIQGNYLTPKEKILKAIAMTEIPNTQIYRLDTRPLEENIEKLHSIKKVYVKRYWFPARLVIALEERTLAFLLTPNLDTEPNSALTSDGILIDKEYLTSRTPQKVKIILTYGIKDGHDEIWDKKKVEKLIEITKAFEAYSGLEVKYLDLRLEKDSYIMLGEYLIRFGEINDTALARIKWIAPILPEAEKNKDNIKYIDLRWEDSRYFCLKNTKEEKSPLSAQENKSEEDIKQVPVKSEENSKSSKNEAENKSVEIVVDEAE